MNIGLANQFARFADSHKIDIYNVIEACNSQPFSHIHQPGIAVGGHCIPIYPRMYLLGDPDASVVRAAREANLEMPAYAAVRLEETHGSLVGESVVVLGATYRGGVKETAFSGVFPLVTALESRGQQSTFTIQCSQAMNCTISDSSLTRRFACGCCGRPSGPLGVRDAPKLGPSRSADGS